MGIKSRLARAIATIAGSFTSLQYSGANSFSGYDIITSTYYFAPAGLDALIARALQTKAMRNGQGDYDATRLTNLGTRIQNETKMLIQLKLQDIYETRLPAMEADDTDATKPFESDTAEGLRKALVDKMPFSDIARYFSTVFTTLIQISGPVPGAGHNATYFQMVKKHISKASFEALRGTINALNDGLQMAPLVGVRYSMADDEDFMAGPPVSSLSDFGQMVLYGSPFEEDVSSAETEYVHGFDADMDLVFHQHFGLSIFYDLLALFTTAGLSRAAGMIEVLNEGALTADKCSLRGASESSTAWTELASNSSLTSIIYNGAVGSGLAWAFEGSLTQTLTNPVDSEDEWDLRLEGFITEYCDKPLEEWPGPYSLAPLPTHAWEAAPLYKHSGQEAMAQGAVTTQTKRVSNPAGRGSTTTTRRTRV